MRRYVYAAAALAVSFVFAGNLLAQQPSAPATTAPAAPAQDFSSVQIKVTDLGHKTYMLQGQGGNITVAVAANGVIMVDSEFAPLHDKIKAAIAGITKQPVRYLIDTHFHGDHTGGNAAFAAEGVGIAAHDNVKKRLEAGSVNGITGAATPPAQAAALPGKTYGKAMKISLRGRTALLKHIPRAHTDGDTAVYFADADVLDTGDVFVTGRHPNIDFANGGSIDGMIAGVDMLLKTAGEHTRIVPGHGQLSTRADLLAYRDMLTTARERMAKLMAEGKSENDIIAAKPYADTDAQVGADDQASRNWVIVLYRSMPKAKARKS